MTEEKRRKPYNLKILNVLKEDNNISKSDISLIETHIHDFPDQRFGQIIINYLCDDYLMDICEQSPLTKEIMATIFGTCTMDPFYEEPWDTLSRLRRQSHLEYRKPLQRSPNFVVNQPYFYVNVDKNKVIRVKNTYSNDDLARHRFGNYFLTYEDADVWLSKLNLIFKDWKRHAEHNPRKKFKKYYWIDNKNKVVEDLDINIHADSARYRLGNYFPSLAMAMSVAKIIDNAMADYNIH